MKKVNKEILVISLGLFGGLASWPFLEFILSKQGSFNNYLIFFIIATMIPGLFLGLFIGCGEGIINKSGKRIVKGSLIGLFTGAAGGVLGGILGQLLLVNILQYFPSAGFTVLLIARSAGWALVGIFVGMSEGVRALSLRKIILGALGGFFGGFLGGLVLEILTNTIGISVFYRLTGLVIMGTMIGVFYTFLDKKYSFGSIRILNGNQAGKRYRINQKQMDLGTGNSTIILSDYDGIEEKEIQFNVDKGVITVIDEKVNKTLFVNDKETTKKDLKYGDVIKSGSIKMLLEAE